MEPFTQLVEQVMTSEPYASADRVFWIVDNGSSHHGLWFPEIVEGSLCRVSGEGGGLVVVR